MTRPMPCGNPIYFEGDILSENSMKYVVNENSVRYSMPHNLVDKRPYGFFKVEVNTPKYLEYPVLQCPFTLL